MNWLNAPRYLAVLDVRTIYAIKAGIGGTETLPAPPTTNSGGNLPGSSNTGTGGPSAYAGVILPWCPD